MSPDTLPPALLIRSIRPGRQHDWPNPQQQKWPHLSEQQTRNLLIMDLAAAEIPFTQPNWPRAAKPKQQEQEQVSRNASLYAEEVAATPFAQTYWPLPPERRWGPGEASYPNLAITVPERPFYQNDWPAPPASLLKANRLQDFIGRSLQEILVGVPFAQFDWPIPPAARRTRQDDQQNLLTGPLAQPFFQPEWPLPQLANRIREFTNPNLHGTVLAGPEMPFARLDWPLPATTKRTQHLDQQNLLAGTLGTPVGPSPFWQLEWPNPLQPQWPWLEPQARNVPLLPAGAVDSPDDIAGLNFSITGSTPIWSDLGITPAVDGDKMSQWDSTAPGGFYLFTVDAVANRPIYNATGHKGCIWHYWESGSAGDTRVGRFHPSYSIDRQSLSGLIIVDVNSSDTRVNLLSFGGFGGANFSIYIQHGTLRVWDGTTALDTGLYVPSRRCAIVFRASASGVTLYIDTAANTATVAASAAGTFTGGTVGEGFPGFSGGWFQLHELHLWPSDIGAGNATDMLAYARSTYTISTSYTRRFLFDGDSLTAGFGAIRNQAYWRVAGLPATDDIFAHPIVGQFQEDAEADAAAEIIPILQGHAAPYYVLRIGTNDLNNPLQGGGDGTVLYNDLVAFANTIKAAVPAVKIVLATTAINPDGSNAAIIAQQAVFNSLLRADFTLPTQTLYGFRAAPGVTYADRLMDFAADPQVGISSSPDPVYRIAGDTIHLTTAGQFIEGGILYYTLLDPPAVAAVPTSFWIPEDRGAAFVPGYRGTRFVVEDRPTTWSVYDR